MMRLWLLTAALLALLNSGCGRQPHPPPPLENSSLLLRLFDNLARDNSEVAAEQAVKLHAQLPDNPYLGKIINTQRANAYVVKADRELRNGNLAAAGRRIDDGLIRYPLNRSLRETRLELDNLEALQRAVKQVETAATAEELDLALNQLQRALRPIPRRSKLHGILPAGRKRVQALREQSPDWRIRTSPVPLFDLTGAGLALRGAALMLNLPPPRETR